MKSVLQQVADQAVERTIARFWSYVDKTSTCWVWTGWHNGRYPGFSIGRVKVYAHRFSYELANGSIPDGLTIDHLCRNKMCVNPAHLEAVTNQQNVLRGDSPKVMSQRRRPDQQLCGTGRHPWVPGAKRCAACKLEANRASRARRKVRPDSVGTHPEVVHHSDAR